MQIERQSSKTSVDVATDVADSAKVSKGGSAGGVVFVPTGSSITRLTYYASYDGTTFLPLYEEVGDGTTWECARDVQDGRAYELPAAVYGAPWIKIKGDAAGSVMLALAT